MRSLMPAHLLDVESSERHTVKPWFAGHADVSPVVGDFPAAGYSLLGARADYLWGQRAAVLVYRHGAHIINVFSWPAAARALPPPGSSAGYHRVCWHSGDLAYCAVSDAGWEELHGLARLLQELAARDAARE
jgi:anti-sigma factor RsiW